MAKKPQDQDAPTEAKKNPCPVTAAEFAEHATGLYGTIKNGDGQPLPFLASPKTFATGSFGWHANEKYTMLVHGKPVKVQMNVLLTVVGSKELHK